MFPSANPLVRLLSVLNPPPMTHLDRQAIDLMEKCLAFSPKKRLDVSEALRHPYLSVRN